MGGSYLDRHENDVWCLYESMSENSMHRSLSSKNGRNVGGWNNVGLYQVDHSNDIVAEVKSLSKKFDQFLINQNLVNQVSSSPNHTHHPSNESCMTCFSTLHSTSNCPHGHVQSEHHEQVNATFVSQGNNPYGTHYNAGWRNHSNFSWKSQGEGSNPPQSGFQSKYVPS